MINARTDYFMKRQLLKHISHKDIKNCPLFITALQQHNNHIFNFNPVCTLPSAAINYNNTVATDMPGAINQASSSLH